MGNRYEVVINNEAEGWFICRSLETGKLHYGVRGDCENKETHAKCAAAMAALEVQ
jgi:hypothetical protein